MKPATTVEIPERRILLEPEAGYRVRWKHPIPVESRPAERAFDRTKCLERMEEVYRNSGEGYWIVRHWLDWRDAISLSKQEARFWLEAIYTLKKLGSNKDTLVHLRETEYLEPLPLEDLVSIDLENVPQDILIHGVWRCYGLEGILRILQKNHPQLPEFADEALHKLVPYLTTEERDSLCQVVLPLLSVESPPELLELALGLGADSRLIADIVLNWPDGYGEPTDRKSYQNNNRLPAITALRDPKLISRELRRLKAFPIRSDDAETIITATEFECLDFIAECIVALGDTHTASSLAEVLQQTESLETAVALATVAINPSTARRSETWWLEHPYFAIQGLAPLIQESSRRGKLALFWLHYLRYQQGDTYVEHVARTLPPDEEWLFRELVLEAPSREILPVASGALSEWLAGPAGCAPSLPKAEPNPTDQERRVNVRVYEQPEPLATSFVQLPTPAVPAFHFGAAIAELVSLRSDRYWNLGMKRFTFPISVPEAHFWLSVNSILGESYDGLTPEILEDRLSQISFGVNYDVSLLKTAYGRFTIPAWTLFGVDGLLAFCFSPFDVKHYFTPRLLPYLSGIERETIATRAFQRIQDKNDNQNLVPGMLELMASLPVSAEQYEAAIREADNRNWDTTIQNPMLPVLLKLPDAARIVELAVEKSIYPNTADEILQWLSVTGFHGTAIARERAKDLTREERVKVLSSIESPEVAAEIAALRKFSTSRVTAESWLDSFPAFAIEGLIPLLVDTDPERVKLAASCLGELDRKGYRERIVKNKERCEPLVQAAIDRHVLDRSAKPAPFYNKKDLELARQLPTLLAYRGTAAFRLNVEQTAFLLALLRTAPLTEPSETLKLVRQNADRATLDRFLWILFQSWFHGDMPNRERWKFEALGHLGGDTIARQLTQSLIHWPYSEKHQAYLKMGLECLRSIGSLVALQQIRKLFGTVGSGPFRKRIGEYIDYLEAAHNQASDEDIDRFTPDAGLDLSCTCTFDLGSRQYTLTLAPDLIPVFRDKAGKPGTVLPKAGKYDSRVKAARAMKTWEWMEQEITIARERAHHLKRAQTARRRWHPDAFYQNLVRHPLLGLLIQGIIWATYDADGLLLQAFRVTEHRTLVDENDCPWTLPDDTVHIGIVHTQDLSIPQQELWKERLADYEIFPPFVQFEKE